MKGLCLVIFFASLASAAPPKITLVPGSFAALQPSNGFTRFLIVSVSSSPAAQVKLNVSFGGLTFDTSGNCTTTSSVVSVSAPSGTVPVNVYACLAYYVQGKDADFALISASAPGFPTTSIAVPITIYPNTNVSLSTSLKALSLGEALTVMANDVSQNGRPVTNITSMAPTYDTTGVTGWLQVDQATNTCKGTTTSCQTTVRVTATQGLVPGTTYSASVQFIDAGLAMAGGAPTQAKLAISFTYSPVSVTSTPLNFVPISPCRIADTRDPAGIFGGPVMGAGTTRSFPVPSNSKCGIPITAQAYALNVTVVPTGPLIYLTIWPAGQTIPLVSTMNSDGRTKANAAIVPAGSNGAVSVFVTDQSHVVLDINGYFVYATDSSALAFYPVSPCRVSDTRKNAGPPYLTGPFGPPSLVAGAIRDIPLLMGGCGVPSTAKAYLLNVTAVPTGVVDWITVAPTNGQFDPNSFSTLNVTIPAAVTANAAIITAGSLGDVSVFAKKNTELIIDLNGYFAPPGQSGALSFYSMVPCRVLDTRLPVGSPPISGQVDFNVSASSCGVPGVAQSYVLSATVVPSGHLGYLRLWAQGKTQPDPSTLNSEGAVTSNMAIVPTTNGSISAYATDPTHLIYDIFGYLAP